MAKKENTNKIFSESQVKVAKFSYSFATDGGAVSAITMRGTPIPSGAVVVTGILSVGTIPTSGGSATIALSIESANDLVTATAYGSSPYSSTGRKSVVPVATGATSILTTAARSVVATVATAALTAGVFDVYLLYFVP